MAQPILVHAAQKAAKIHCPDGCCITIAPDKKGIYRTHMCRNFNEAHMDMYATIIEWAFRVIING